MFIKQVVIEGEDGDVEVSRLDEGALVTSGDRVLCVVQRDESREARHAKAYEVAKVVCGTDPKGRPNATNSMVHEVLAELNRVAGC